MNKVTPEVKKYLQEIERQLPVVGVAGAKIRVKGSSFIDAYKKNPKNDPNDGPKDKSGKLINPDATYHVESQSGHNVNHFKKLKKAFESGGSTAVNAYVQKILGK